MMMPTVALGRAIFVIAVQTKAVSLG